MADEAAASQAREQFDPSLTKHAFGGAATHFDDQPTEPSALGGMANSALERGIRAVVDILFDGGALDDANASAGSDGFGIEKVSFEVHLGRAGSGAPRPAAAARARSSPRASALRLDRSRQR